ncbi:hypothetical protein CVH13_00254 [Dehalococcoides mccartyi]|uniref:Uncharacterized protein n=1 Tax=Dehalococcoides mccartyi TaxID=61435 RepID=A0A2J1E061_9CHLR|nr:hypothetical protein CVH13_00254 [Dehalococcoides mccartyi]
MTTDEGLLAAAQAIANALESLGNTLSAALDTSVTTLMSTALSTGLELFLLAMITVLALWKRHIVLDILAGLGWFGISFTLFSSASLIAVMPFATCLALGIFMFYRIIEDTGRIGR